MNLPKNKTLTLILITLASMISFSGHVFAGEELLPGESLNESQDHMEAVYDDTQTLTPDEEYKVFGFDLYGVERIFQVKSSRHRFKFAQTTWNECKDTDFSGNYLNRNCVPNRPIAQILYDFMKDNLYDCVQSSADTIGLGNVTDIHIQHRGIIGDVSHSSRSLHSENRAIDLKSLVLRMNNGKTVRRVYAEKGNDKFFSQLRSCWGKAIRRDNGCPLYEGRYDRTGSIGTEDPSGRHDGHIHMSVPYCVRGKYAGKYFQR